MVLFLLGMLHTGLILNDDNLQNLGGGGKGWKSPPSNGLAHVQDALAFIFHPGETYMCLTTNKMSGYTQNIAKNISRKTNSTT